MSAAARVVVVGSINVDIMARVERHPRPGETVLGQGGTSRPGGKGANQAVAAALAQAQVEMVGAVGDDAHAPIGTSLLTRAGVDLRHVRTAADTPTGVALITVSADGENSIVVVPGANAQVTPDDVDAAAQDWDANTVVVLQGEVPVPAIERARERCAATGGRLVLNLAPVVQVTPDTLRAADPLVVNEHEARAAAHILGVDTDTEDDARGAALDDVGRAAEVVNALRSAGVDAVVMTLGGLGALVATPHRMTHLPAVPVDVVDTTGAGDAFVGTLAADLALGRKLLDSARAANAIAAQAVQRAGAQDSYPGWDGR